MGHSPSTEFAFQAWPTPFENTAIELMGAEFSGNGALSFRVCALENGAIYRVDFEYVSAFRVLDELSISEQNRVESNSSYPSLLLELSS
ncbi:hypothetical protein [Agrobacterium sp. NPDC089420]|uniref:hypothetical protein n=1 Tax=Agrobacterium sp. NPDC089420 TaxID=3363918 RepID=UPI00384B73CF